MKRLKVIVDAEECIGDRLCCEEAPNTFEMNDDDKAVPTDPPADDEESILEAARCCPTDAIQVVDVDTGEVLYPEE